jgi:two-component system catabolic regulation response regulator CreB
VRARLRRAAEAGGWTSRGDFAIDAEGHRIRYRGAPLDLTRYEHALLAALLQRPGAILTRAQLLDRGWEAGSDSGDRTVDTHVKTLRAKLRAAGADPDPIRTHRGLGYSLEA